MSSQSSRSVRSGSVAQGRELLCHHGVRAVLCTSSTKENPGRRFWAAYIIGFKKVVSFSVGQMQNQNLRIHK
ncbi:hypothetical protein PIB30_087986 [Stylosanthes scabra]|uniref:Uncharacterized protein n=1 Tax=Stylosanthes scabra TaxID=79078 RepID=A0ABU6YUC5_9FABA|nr:hypothetical protein [Stylosanthes scabra]